mgnify:CR=1 FL=1
MAIAKFLESYVFGPSGSWTMAPLRYAAKFDTFLSLDCVPTHALQGKEGIKFCYLATLETGEGEVGEEVEEELRVDEETLCVSANQGKEQQAFAKLTCSLAYMF